MSNELKPCPFCGGEAFINTVESHAHEVATFMPDYPGGTFIECTSCTCALSGETEDKAIEAWNTRKPIDKVVEQLESKKVDRNIFNRRGDAIGCIHDTKIEIDDAIEIVKGGAK